MIDLLEKKMRKKLSEYPFRRVPARQLHNDVIMMRLDRDDTKKLLKLAEKKGLIRRTKKDYYIRRHL